MKAQVCTVYCKGPGLSAPGLEGVGLNLFNNIDNSLTPCEAYQSILEDSDSELLIYCHDDLTIHDPDWLTRVLAEFTSHPNTVVVGLGGALVLGHPDMYKKPYALGNMARYGYRSNQSDWGVHGELEEDSCRVAVVDAFFMAIRRDWLMTRRTLIPRPTGGVTKDGVMEYDLGWPVHALTHHLLDLWVCCEAAKDNKEVRMVGVSCTHHGGGSSTKPAYREAKWLQGGSLEEDHRQPHRWLADSYRDVLPIQVNS